MLPKEISLKLKEMSLNKEKVLVIQAVRDGIKKINKLIYNTSNNRKEWYTK